MTKRSHYLPQTYLKHFLLGDDLFMYKKGEKFFKPEITSDQRIVPIMGEDALINFGLENNLYNPEISSITSDDIEKIFQEYGENFLDDVISKVEEKSDREPLETEIKDKLCVFLAAMRVRTPLFKQETEQSSSLLSKHMMSRRMENVTAAQLKEEMSEKGKDYTEEQIEVARKALIDKRYKLKWPNDHFIKFALIGLDLHTDIFRKMKMVIFRSDRYFITSDNPVVYFVPREKANFYNHPRSLMSPYTEVFFPLTRNMGVHLSRGDLKEIVMDVKRDSVEVFNYNVSHNSFNFIFSPIKMNDLKKFIEEYHPYPFELKMS